METKDNFSTFTTKYRDKVNSFLKMKLETKQATSRLPEAMAYSVNAGGKRLRPLLTLAVLATFNVPVTPARLQAATALELLHTYSLIHDDLPAMDNDDLRRGEPTNHVQFGAGMATLAGDGLLTLAFEWLSSAKLPVLQRLELVSSLSRAAGPSGMVAGQAIDIENTHHQLSYNELRKLHAGKTGALIQYSVVAGGIMSDASPDILACLSDYGSAYGLAFQIYDDLMDVIGDSKTMGKRVHKDAAEQKNTYPGLFGIDGTVARLNQTVLSAKKAVTQLQTMTTIEPDLLLSFLEYFEIKES